MHPIRKQRIVFIILLALALAAAVALALYALKQNINVFFTPSQLHQQTIAANQTIRVGGLVRKGSVRHEGADNTVRFVITDTAQEVTVYYQGLLPDLFREGKGVVAEGRVNLDGSFQASQVLAKHDENYMPPQVAESLSPQALKGAA